MTVKKKDTSTEDTARKKQASELLKNADKFLKAGDFKAALQEVENALEIDPGNFYARAYKDRIFSAKQHATMKSGDGFISQEEAEFKMKLHAEQQRIEEEKKRSDADHQRAEEELRRRALEDETKRVQEGEEKKRRDEEIKKKLDQDRMLVEAETRKRIDEEKQRLQEELRKREELARQNAEEEAKRKIEEKEKLRKTEEEERKRKAEEADRKQREEEERKRAEEEVKRKREEEFRKRAEEERVRKEEEEFILKEQEIGKQEALNQRFEKYLIRARQCFDSKAYDESLFEIFKIYSLNQDNLEAKQLESLIIKEKSAIEEEKLKELKIIPRQFFLDIYRRSLILAWSEGIPSQEEQSLIIELGAALNISPDEHRKIEPFVKSEAYIIAVRKAWQDGTLSPEEVRQLERLRDELDINPETHLAIEQQIRKELGF